MPLRQVQGNRRSLQPCQLAFGQAAPTAVGRQLLQVLCQPGALQVGEAALGGLGDLRCESEGVRARIGEGVSEGESEGESEGVSERV